MAEAEAEAQPEGDGPRPTGDESQFLEPTQKLSDVRGLALFPD